MRELDSERWALDTFGGAGLGDARRTKRLVRVAASAAARPAGTVTSVLQKPCEREAAYRLLENERVCPRELARSVGEATARRARARDWVYVAVDQTTLSFIDRKNLRGLGRVADGAYRNCRGLEVVNGLAVDPDGRTLGMSAMRWRVRPDASTQGRAPAARESAMWREVMTDTAGHFRLHAPHTTLWFQLDAGADHALNFFKANELGHHITVRCQHNRWIQTDAGRGKLFDEVSRAPRLGIKALPKTRRRGRARLAVRAAAVTVLFPALPVNNAPRVPVDLYVVQVRQVGRVAAGRERICWNLLTTYPVEELGDALEVVEAYTMRWRIEDFYRTWKNGHCRLEDSQLRSRGAILRWAIILGAVAARIERIKHRSREEPDASASSEFTRDEIDAAITLSRSEERRVGKECRSRWSPYH